jgi:hypothetical protein
MDFLRPARLPFARPEFPTTVRFLSVRFLGVDNGDIRLNGGHGCQSFAGERALNEFDLVIVFWKVRTGVGSQHRKWQIGCARNIGVRKIAVAVLLNFQRRGPIVLDSIAQAVQRADAWISSPGKNEFASATSSDHLIVNDVGGHTHQGQILSLLADDFMASGKGNQVGKAFQGNGLAVTHKARYCFTKIGNFGHGSYQMNQRQSRRCSGCLSNDTHFSLVMRRGWPIGRAFANWHSLFSASGSKPGHYLLAQAQSIPRRLTTQGFKDLPPF